jgi:hypothetical protein
MKFYRFSLRELFLLVVIAAMGCGWWVDRSRLAEGERSARQSNTETRRAYEQLRTMMRIDTAD